MNVLAFVLLLMLAVGVRAESFVFINHQQGSSVAVYEKDSMKLVTEIPSLEGPTGIVISQNGDWLAVSYPEKGIISYLDSKRLIPLEHLQVGGAPFGLTIASGKLFYSDWNGDFVGIIEPGSGRILKKIPVGSSPAGLVTAKCQALVLVANREDNSVSLIDADTLKVIKNIEVGERPFAIDTDGRFAYVVNSGSNDMSIIDMNSLSEVDRVATGRMPYGVATAPEQHKIYVSNQMENTVSVFDSRTRKRIALLKTGEYPENIAVDESGLRLYVLNWFDASLSVFDTGTETELLRKKLKQNSRAFGYFVEHDYIGAVCQNENQ